MQQHSTGLEVDGGVGYLSHTGGGVTGNGSFRKRPSGYWFPRTLAKVSHSPECSSMSPESLCQVQKLLIRQF